MIANRWPFTPPTPNFFSIICENRCYYIIKIIVAGQKTMFSLRNKRRLMKKSVNLNKYGPFFIIFPLPVMLKFTVHITAVHLFTCVAMAVTSRRSRESNVCVSNKNIDRHFKKVCTAQNCYFLPQSIPLCV